jgi:hypothetical protein
MTTHYTFREIAGLTKLIEALLSLGAIMAAVSLLSSLMQAELLSRSSFTQAEGYSNDIREQTISLLNLPLYLFTVITFGRWIVRANKNVWALGAHGLRMTPGWAVGYFFIPFLNLWRPYQAMKDLWRASHSPSSWSPTAAGSILPAWWTLWLFSCVLGQMSFRAAMAAKGLDALRAATYTQIVSHAVDIPLCLVAISLVSQIALAQKTHVQTSTPPPAPAPTTSPPPLLAPQPPAPAPPRPTPAPAKTTPLYLYVDEELKGPYLADQIKGLLAENAITRETPCCHEGAPAWQTVADYVT